MTKKEMIFYYDNGWLQHILGSEKRWHLKGSLSYYTVLQLELFCARAEERVRFPMHSIYAITSRGKEVRWLPAYSAAVWKETQEKICCMKESGRKWEWGHVMSHLKSHSGQYGSPTWPGNFRLLPCCGPAHSFHVFIFSLLMGND